MAMNAVEAAACLAALVKQVNDAEEAVAITSTRGTAYLVPADEYMALRETAYLLRSPRNADRLRTSVAEVRRGGRPAQRWRRPARFDVG